MNTNIREIQEGDILLANWGYEANNPDFVKVIKKTKTMATLMFLKNTMVSRDAYPDANGGGCYVIPSNEPATWSCFANPGHEQGTPVVIRRDRKSTRLNSSHIPLSRMPSSA